MMKNISNIKFWALLGVVILTIGLFKSNSVMIATAVIIFALLCCTIDILKAIQESKQ
ncbi:MAG: hypothetical protein ACJA0H_001132 [Francisellaceae bacterium]|jgi:hypothetical protein